MSQIASSLRGSSSPATWGSHRNNIAAKHPKLRKRNFVKGSKLAETKVVCKILKNIAKTDNC